MADLQKGEDYISQHFAEDRKDRLQEDVSAKIAHVPAYTTTESPKSSRPMSTARKIAAGIIVLSHIFAFYALYDAVFTLTPIKGLKWFIAAVIFYYFTVVPGITSGAHRLWAHRSYEANLPVRIFLLIVNSISNQGSILQWATDHRVHHMHVDTDADPHNIHRGFFFAHMGWLFSPRTDAYVEAKHNIDISDLKKDPVVMVQDKYYHLFGPFFCYILPTLMGYYYANDAWRGFLYLANLRWILALHATWFINSVSHIGSIAGYPMGSRPYSPMCEARDNILTSIFAGGEGWHAYHHAYAWSYMACEQDSLFGWNDPSGVTWRFNTGRFFIDLFAALGGVSNRKICRNIQRAPVEHPSQITALNPLMRDELREMKAKKALD